MKSILILAASAAFLTSAAPAMAQPPEINRILIDVRDIDLTTKVGRQEVDRRLTSAAAVICDAKRLHDDTEATGIEACMSAVRAHASKKIAEQVAIAIEHKASNWAVASN